jgi:hypothetical protein
MKWCDVKVVQVIVQYDANSYKNLLFHQQYP